MIAEQTVLPAIRDMRDLEMFLKSDLQVGVLLEIHIGRLQAVNKLLADQNKKVFIHIDLIQGLKADEHATEYICQTFKPYGIISTKTGVIQKAKQNGVLTVQRLFLIDSHALEKSVKHVGRSQPDYIEVLPGLVPKYIRVIREVTGIPVFAGGLISSRDEVEAAIDSGAAAVTSSNHRLWST